MCNNQDNTAVIHYSDLDKRKPKYCWDQNDWSEVMTMRIQISQSL